MKKFGAPVARAPILVPEKQCLVSDQEMEFDVYLEEEFKE